MCKNVQSSERSAQGAWLLCKNSQIKGPDSLFWNHRSENLSSQRMLTLEQGRNRGMTHQSLASTCREEPRRYEMERKVTAEKRMKGRMEQGSRQGHRCDIPLTMREAGLNCADIPSWLKLSPSCLVHPSIKSDIFLIVHSRRDRFIGLTRRTHENGVLT